MEVGPEAARTVDPRLVQRLVGLETADIDVPPPPDASLQAPLYFRVLADSAGSLRVELWELGHPQGARRVAGAGTEQLKARRIALAAAELSRQFRRKRIAEIEAQGRPKQDDHATRDADGGFPIFGKFVWNAGGRAASVAGSGAWLAGPDLGTALRFSTRQRVELGAAWLVGHSGALGGVGTRWLEGNLAVLQGFALSKTVEVQAGLGAAISSVRAASTDSWSGRAFAAARLELRLGSAASLSFGPDLGAVLHPVTITTEDGRERRLGGLWAGAELGLHLSP